MLMVCSEEKKFRNFLAMAAATPTYPHIPLHLYAVRVALFTRTVSPVAASGRHGGRLKPLSTSNTTAATEFVTTKGQPNERRVVWNAFLWPAAARPVDAWRRVPRRADASDCRAAA